MNIIALIDSPPVVSNVSADPYNLLPGNSTTLAVEAIDPDLEPLSYMWQVIELVSYTWTAPIGGLSPQTDSPDNLSSQIRWTAPTPTEVGATDEVLVSDPNGATAGYVFAFR